jgi:hypothetical protein
MKKNAVALVLLMGLLLVPSLAFARGGGGLEYFVNMGSDILGGVTLPDAFMTDYVSGTIMGVSGYGYGINRGGWKIGGFGTFFYTAPLGLDIPAYDTRVISAVGGIGGVISGGHGRLGPFTFALNTRLGAGGMGIELFWPGGLDGWNYWSGSFLLYGSADVEVGIVFVPAMMVSVYAGVQGIVPIPYVVAACAVPSMGLRITWGAF